MCLPIFFYVGDPIFVDDLIFRHPSVVGLVQRAGIATTNSINLFKTAANSSSDAAVDFPTCSVINCLAGVRDAFNRTVTTERADADVRATVKGRSAVFAIATTACAIGAACVIMWSVVQSAPVAHMVG